MISIREKKSTSCQIQSLIYNLHINFCLLISVFVLSYADTLLQHRKSSVSWSAANNFFQRGLSTVTMWQEGLALVPLLKITCLNHSFFRFLPCVTIQPFWTKVKHRVCSGIENLKLLYAIYLSYSRMVYAFYIF